MAIKHIIQRAGKSAYFLVRHLSTAGASSIISAFEYICKASLSNSRYRPAASLQSGWLLLLLMLTPIASSYAGAVSVAPKFIYQGRIHPYYAPIGTPLYTAYHSTVRGVCEDHAAEWAIQFPGTYCESVTVVPAPAGSPYNWWGELYTITVPPQPSCCWGSFSFAPNRQYFCDGTSVGPEGICPTPRDTSPPLCLSTKHPIAIGTGNKFLIETDYIGMSPFPLSFKRYYNKSVPIPSSEKLAPGPNDYAMNVDGAWTTLHALYSGVVSALQPSITSWSGSYKRTILNGVPLVSKTLVTAAAQRPNGGAYYFSKTSNDWVPNSNVTATLGQLFDSTGNLSGWRYTTPEDEMEIYDATGRLRTITNRAGLTHTLTYSDGTVGPNGGYVLDAQGLPSDVPLPPDLLLRVADDFGHSLQFGYDAYSRTVLMLDPENRRYSYEYDTKNNLTKVTYPDGKTKQYLYGEPAYTSGVSQPNALTGVIDENGIRYASYWYNTSGLAINEELAPDLSQGIDKFALSYNINAYGAPISTTVIDPLGASRTYNLTTILGEVKSTGQSQPGGSGCGPAGSATTYDANGNVASRTDFNGIKTTYTYDLTRNLETRRTEAYGKPEARTISTSWHPGYRLPTKIAEPLRLTSYSYDLQGNLLSKTVQATLDANGSQGLNATPVGLARTTAYTYNPWGQVLTVDGPRTDVSDITYYEYNSQGNLTRITDALGHVTQIMAYDANGRPLAIIDPNLIATQLSYDARGRLIQRAVESDVTTYVYDGVGQLTRLTQPDGSVLSYTYDGAHRLTGIADGQGNRIAYTLDAMGNRIREDVLDPSGQLARTRRQAYDSLGRLSQVLDSQNHATLYGYDANGNQTSATDANGAITRNSYDPLNRLIQILDPLNGATRTQYNALDQITQVTDPRNIATAYSVTGLGDVTSEASPDTGTATRTYDAAGNLTGYTDASGTSITYQYDALNRLTRTGNLITYTWDSSYIGKLAQIQDPSGSTRYQYDLYGRLSSKTQTQDSLSQTLSYAWQPGHLLVQLITPGGNQIGYTYAHGKPGGISVNGQALLSSITYEPHGPVSGWTWGNGLPHVRAHGLDGEVQRIESAVATTYGYDLAGQLNSQHVWSQTTPLQHDTQSSFSLDAAGRLSAAQTLVALPQGTISDSLAYGYDANGNRQSIIWNGIATQYAYSANRLAQSSGASNRIYAWDAAGRMTGDGFYTYTYNALGRLAAVSGGAGSLASYRYNAMGQRVAKDTASGNVRFAYDEAGHLLGEYDSTGRTIQEIVWLGDLPVASIRPKPTGGTEVFYIHPDHLGTPRQITDSLNRMVWRWDTAEPFGSELPNEDPDGDGIRFEFNLRFPGQYYDKETGRHYNWFRDYDPGTGRYTTSDLIGLRGGGNRYLYTGGSPSSYIDPHGLTRIGVDVANGIMTVDPEQPGRAPYTMKITSGKGSCMNQPQCSDQKDKGPIPYGDYTADISKLSNPNLFGDAARRLTGDWGDWRVPLAPDPGTILPPGRTGDFFLHGGGSPGSKGCIDFGGGLWGNDSTNRLLRDLLADPDKKVPVIVR